MWRLAKYSPEKCPSFEDGSEPLTGGYGANGTATVPVDSCGIGILPMIHGLQSDRAPSRERTRWDPTPKGEGSPTGDVSPVGTQFCVGGPKPRPH
jgi:hypothetical protein